MSVLIGHASIDENKRVRGGIAGDQTGKELCTRTWYNKPWDYVLRCKDTNKAELMAVACEQACANNHIGYDQNQRNTLRTQAIVCGYDLSRITVDCECDCSSLMAVCAECAGIRIPYSGSNAPTTSTMKTAFLNTGYFNVISSADYTHSDKLLKRGDILVKAGSHTVMVLSNIPKVTIQNAVNAADNVYNIGSTYTLQSNLYIRDDADGNKKKFSCISADAQKHSHFDEYGYAILEKGTRVTCKEVKKLQTSTWIRIPSGWICANNRKAMFVSI